MVQFEVLGPVRVRAGAGEVPVTGRRERIVLAMLLLDAGRPVPTDRLIDAVWGATPPASARNQIQVTVSQLRRRFANAGATEPLLVTDLDSYRVQLQPHQLDLSEFRAEVSAARRTAAAPARDGYRTALGRWRGPAFAGIDSTPIRAAAATLDEERLHAHEECLRLELALGAGGELVTELTELIAAYPYRERLHAFLMQALYRAGRRADALAAFRRIRRLLHDELGTEPGAELQRLHRAVLNGDAGQPAPTGTAHPAVPPAQLPPEVAAFTGRAPELARLDVLLPDPSDDRPAPVAIAVIDGTAGVGKTALAVHWAHRVRGHFPDGQLYIDLRGHAAGPPLPPIEALARFLHALGVPAERVPSGTEEAAAAYRSLLADKRMLVVLDNAASAEQIRPLLPAGAGCVALATSRDRLAGLVAREGARQITLDVLAPAESLALLSSLLGEDRVRAEPQPAAELAQTCAHLPLALRITAANLRGRPHSTVAAHVRQLRGSDRLAGLAVAGDEQVAVRAAFDLSYARLPAPVRRMFRLLGLVPGPDLTTGAAAALAGATSAQAATMLQTLARAHLVEEYAPGRYTCHDLLRHFAAACATAEEPGPDREAALERLFHWYLRVADTAAGLLYPHMLRLPMPEAPAGLPAVELDGPTAAVTYLDGERANLTSAIEHAAEYGPRWLAWTLADRLRGYFLHGGHMTQWRAAATAALAASEQDGDLRAQAAARLSLGDLHLRQERLPVALEHYAATSRLAEQSNWAGAQSAALTNGAMAHWSMGRLDLAAEQLAQALTLDRRLGRLTGQVTCLGNLGAVYNELGRLRLSAETCLEAVALARKLGSREAEATALTNLGCAVRDQGRLDEAADHLDEALALRREGGYQFGEAYALEALSELHLDAGRYAEALATARAAARLAGEVSARHAEAEALVTIGAVHLQLRQPRRALECHQRALELAEANLDRLPEIGARLGLARACQELGRRQDAVSHANRALTLAGEFGYGLRKGQALTVLADLHFRQGGDELAAEYARRALDSHRRTGHRLGEARSHLTLGEVRQRAGDEAAAAGLWRQAHALFTDIGAPEARHTAALLAGLPITVRSSEAG